ncbi:MAG: GNAT family N-acetyltransferase [Candidatus Rokubacteria bacterium]|nr:GNAT family N-acetyltransferase [Candidatus Rokubacteria bacterium]
MRVERLSAWGAGGLDETAWNGLLARSATDVPFLTWQWQTAWWEAFGPGPLALFVVRDGETPIGLLPLYGLEAGGRTVLRLVGEEEIWKALLPSLLELRWDLLDLHCLPAASPSLQLLPGLARAWGLAVEVEREERCPVVELPESWEAYLARLSGKDRHELRRKLRRLETRQARTSALTTPAAVAAVLDTFLGLHRKSKAGKARFMDARMEGFFRAVALAFARAGWLALWILWVEGRPAASLLCLDYGSRVSLYNSGFDPEAARLSPGVGLIAASIRDAIGRGRRRYDFLRGEEPYKYGFGAVPADVFAVRLRRR